MPWRHGGLRACWRAPPIPEGAAMRNPQHDPVPLSPAQLAAIAEAATGCARPVRLRGWLYKGDTWQVLIAGLRGGHGIPADVSSHPAVFVTLTAPSFGPVHRGARKPGQQPPRCRPRRDRPVCEHGQPMSCGRRHRDGDPLTGQPLCGECFDYHGAVLFNASVPALWAAFARALPSALARELGITRKVLRQHLRLSFGKVIEYQRRGLIHVHAVIRADGPDGPGDDPPPWADVSLLR